MTNIYWDILVKESRELIASAEKTGHEYVGVQRAKAIVEVDEELKEMREHFKDYYWERTVGGANETP